MNECIKHAIDRLKKEYGTYNPFLLSDYLGIEIVYVPFLDNPQGQYVKLFDVPTILINEKLKSSSRRYFVLAHEIYHYLEHEDLAGYYILNSITRGKMESEANAFASALLFNYYIEDTGSLPSTVDEIVFAYGVPRKITEDYI
ncbi:ImmA/IrrE family metallo-endopeptidase [Atopococcus tabaci]|uniref:ImmA/IrrE family metallo-endopeptidase n=1 Tax=Atopococcus tabaci TaxID=269774 RepID=UPI00240A66A3|nr:ImmA/IrrE family metallo-endopeptidase [Atopococcus tabaci]